MAVWFNEQIEIPQDIKVPDQETKQLLKNVLEKILVIDSTQKKLTSEVILFFYQYMSIYNNIYQ